jgi:hypothetical protein
MTAVHPEASRQVVVETALVLLERMGLSPADQAAVPQARPPVLTFAEYVPVVSAAVSAGTRRAYGSYPAAAHRDRLPPRRSAGPTAARSGSGPVPDPAAGEGRDGSRSRPP